MHSALRGILDSSGCPNEERGRVFNFIYFVSCTAWLNTLTRARRKKASVVYIYIYIAIDYTVRYRMFGWGIFPRKSYDTAIKSS